LVFAVVAAIALIAGLSTRAAADEGVSSKTEAASMHQTRLDIAKDVLETMPDVELRRPENLKRVGEVAIECSQDETARNLYPPASLEIVQLLRTRVTRLPDAFLVNGSSHFDEAKFRILGCIGRWANDKRVKDPELARAMTDLLEVKATNLEPGDQVKMASFLVDVGTRRSIASASTILKKLHPANNPRLSADNSVIAAEILHTAGSSHAEVRQVLDSIPIGLLDAKAFEYFLLSGQVAVEEDVKGSRYSDAARHTRTEPQRIRLLKAIVQETPSAKAKWQAKVTVEIINLTTDSAWQREELRTLVSRVIDRLKPVDKEGMTAVDVAAIARVSRVPPIAGKRKPASAENDDNSEKP
jgi:hypothetical protein